MNGYKGRELISEQVRQSRGVLPTYIPPVRALDLSYLTMPPANSVLWLPGVGDPNSSTITDRSGQGNHGTIRGASWERTGQGLWYLDFNGTDQDITVADAASLRPTAITLLGWFNHNSDTPTQRMFYRQNGNPYGVYFHVSSDILYSDFGDGSARHRLTNNLTAADFDDTWCLYAATYDGTTQRHNFNGSELGTTLEWSGTLAYQPSTDIVIGGDGTSEMHGLGTLYRIINQALSAAEIASIYNQERHLFGV